MGELDGAESHHQHLPVLWMHKSENDLEEVWSLGCLDGGKSEQKFWPLREPLKCREKF